MGEAGTGEDGAGENGAGEDGAGEAGTGEDGAGEDGACGGCWAPTRGNRRGGGGRARSGWFIA